MLCLGKYHDIEAHIGAKFAGGGHHMQASSWKQLTDYNIPLIYDRDILSTPN